MPPTRSSGDRAGLRQAEVQAFLRELRRRYGHRTDLGGEDQHGSHDATASRLAAELLPLPK